MEKIEMWAILELLGHRRVAGFVREVEIAGTGMLRVDIPIDPPVTQFIGPGSIYCMTPATEEAVREIAKRMANPAPVQAWELPVHNDDGIPK